MCVRKRERERERERQEERKINREGGWGGGWRGEPEESEGEKIDYGRNEEGGGSGGRGSEAPPRTDSPALSARARTQRADCGCSEPGAALPVLCSSLRAGPRMAGSDDTDRGGSVAAA